jgi:putative ABC transport system substrate-binding protein
MRLARLFILLLPIVAAGPLGAQEERHGFVVRVLFWDESPNDKLAFQGVKEGFALAGIRWNYTFEMVNGDREKADAFLRAWEAEGVDLVYAMGTQAALRAKAVLESTRVVFTAVTDPIRSGVVEDVHGSGRNLCGNTNRIDIEDKLAVFRRAVPGLVRLGVLHDPANPVSAAEIAEAEEFFRLRSDQRIALFERPVTTAEALAPAARSLIEEDRVQAIWIPIDRLVYRESHLGMVAEVAAPAGVPLVSSQHSAVKTHAVVAVAVDYRLLGMKSVVLAERVLRDEVDPGTLPIEGMRSFRVLVNLAAARRCGFEPPLTLLATADEILPEER